MKIKVRKSIETLEEIDVDFPYYYKYDACSDSGTYLIFGKITGEEVLSIDESIDYDGQAKYEFEKEKFNLGFSSYITDDDHKSSQQEFEAAKERAVLFLNRF